MPGPSKEQLPPVALIQTWVWMMMESGNPELQEKGRSNLVNTFETLAKANAYLAEKLKQ